ncbi:MAG: aminotransferase class V-fold PLP-dependent enzyme [Pseudomonadota bacterium]
MFDQKPGLMDDIRSRFAHVDTCPFEGKRIFFENAGGALTLKSVVETSAKFAAIPDNQGRANGASAELMRIIADAKAATMTFLNATDGQVFVGESGTELLFRIIRDACIGSAEGSVIGSTIEHPASRSAALRWAEEAGKTYLSVPHDDATGTVSAAAYAAIVRPDTRVATILHTSPVTGMGNDVAAIAQAIRAAAPDCLIIVDGIQHAAHGHIDIAAYCVDAYVMSAYKVFSRHGYGVAWIGPAVEALRHDALVDGPVANWELGTRDTGAYATFADVIAYFGWLGSAFSEEPALRPRLEAAARAIRAHEKALTDAMINGVGNHAGLAAIDGVQIIGGAENPAREGLVCFRVEGQDEADLVEALNRAGIRTHIRRADHYSGSVLRPLGMEAAIRVSLCHYNTVEEVGAFLDAVGAAIAA